MFQFSAHFPYIFIIFPLLRAIKSAIYERRKVYFQYIDANRIKSTLTFTDIPLKVIGYSGNNR